MTTTVSRLALLALATLGLGATGLARASDLNAVGTLNQAQFRLLSQDLGSALSYKPMVPAAGLGITGFDIGASVGATQLAHRGDYGTAFGGSAPRNLPLASVRAVKGLPFDIDVGVAISSLPSTNMRSTGGELRWAFVPGNLVLPALALRVSGTALSGVDNLKFRTMAADLSISKGFAMFTPYAGFGQVRSKSTPGAGTGLVAESFGQSKVFAGLNMNFGLVNLALETDKTGDAASYGLKFGFRF